MNLERDKLVWMYRTMLRVRRFEEKLTELYAKAVVPGPAHLYIGEEAIAAGVCANLRPDDNIVSGHRGHGHFIAKGARLDRTMAEMLGKATGYNGGYSGSMHLARVEDGGIHLSSSIVAAGIPIAAGLALSSKIKKTGQVTVCFFGDGASNQGTFHEGINIASIFDLPVVYVCENNGMAVFTPISYSAKVKRIAERAVAYGIPGITVDGTDPLAVYEAANNAIQKARSGMGPTLLECMVEKWRPHGEGQRDNRSPEEIARLKKEDPIEKFRMKLVETKTLTSIEADQIQAEVSAEVEEAVKFARGSADPVLEEVTKNVYA